MPATHPQYFLALDHGESVARIEPSITLIGLQNLRLRATRCEGGRQPSNEIPACHPLTQPLRARKSLFSMALHLPIAQPTPLEDTPGGAKPIRVGDLAQRTHKTVRALHLYEELGLLAPVERSRGGYRLYADDAQVRVRWIAKLQDMGFSLPDIRTLLREWEQSASATSAMAHMRDIYERKLEETRVQIARLESLRVELEHSVQYLDTCEVCEPERLIHYCPKCDHHDCGAPELVAGFHAGTQ